MVCHAIIMAMTVVLPAPVANFSAMRLSSGLASLLTSASLSRTPRSVGLSLGATSLSHISVSTASTWQKNGRKLLNLCCRQCRSSLAVSGVTPQLLGPGYPPPFVNPSADLVDGCGDFVLLLSCGEAHSLIDVQALLACSCSSSLPGFRNRRNEFRATPALDSPLGRLAVLVQLPMALRVLVGRVQNWLVKKWIFHGLISSWSCQ